MSSSNATVAIFNLWKRHNRYCCPSFNSQVRYFAGFLSVGRQSQQVCFKYKTIEIKKTQNYA